MLGLVEEGPGEGGKEGAVTGCLVQSWTGFLLVGWSPSTAQDRSSAPAGRQVGGLAQVAAMIMWEHLSWALMCARPVLLSYPLYR